MQSVYFAAVTYTGMYTVTILGGSLTVLLEFNAIFILFFFCLNKQNSAFIVTNMLFKIKSCFHFHRKLVGGYIFEA